MSLVEIVSESVNLRRSGKSFMGLCPFHAEKTASFHVNEEEGFYHCFGCGAKGNVYNYLMQTRGYTFPEAVRYLAGKAGIRLPEELPYERKEKEKASARIRLFRELMLGAAEIYRSCLMTAPPGRAGREYLRQRGISEKTAESFFLGFAPDSWTFIEEALVKHSAAGGKNLPCAPEKLPQLLVEAGLLRQKSSAAGTDKTRHYDVFRHRLIFPITRSDGACIAFGGRLITKDDQAPKYLNSAESPLYAKRRSFYGLSQALPVIRKTRHAYLMEGYMDVLSMHQAGFTAALATCGTAVTPDHARIISRLVNRLTVVFDGDNAGRKAAAQCFSIFLNSGVDISVVLLEEGEDPDSLAQRCSPEEVAAVFARSQKPLGQVYIDYLKMDVAGQEADADPSAAVFSAAASGKMAARYAAAIAAVVNPVEKELLIRQGAEYLGVSAQSLLGLVDNETRRKQGEPARPVPRGSAASRPENRWEDPPESWAADEGEIDLPADLDLSSMPALPPPEPSMGGDEHGAEHGLAGYYRQLVVALISEPDLAREVVEMPSVLSGSGVYEALPEGIKGLIQELKQGEVAGVSGMAAKIKDGGRKGPEFEQLQEILERHGLGDYNLLEEAINQAWIGGGDPASVIANAQVEVGRRSLKEEMQHIRAQEARQSDAEKLEQLAQEKLAKKRALDRLREG